MLQPSVGMTRREGQGGFNYLASIPEGMQGTCTIVHDLAYNGTDIPTWHRFFCRRAAGSRLAARSPQNQRVQAATLRR